MSRCPVCESPRIVVVLDPNSRAYCPECGAWWAQEGSRQTNITRAVPSPLIATPTKKLSDAGI